MTRFLKLYTHFAISIISLAVLPLSAKAAEPAPAPAPLEIEPLGKGVTLRHHKIESIRRPDSNLFPGMRGGGTGTGATGGTGSGVSPKPAPAPSPSMATKNDDLIAPSGTSK